MKGNKTEEKYKWERTEQNRAFHMFSVVLCPNLEIYCGEVRSSFPLKMAKHFCQSHSQIFLSFVTNLTYHNMGHEGVQRTHAIEGDATATPIMADQLTATKVQRKKNHSHLTQ